MREPRGPLLRKWLALTQQSLQSTRKSHPPSLLPLAPAHVWVTLGTAAALLPILGTFRLRQVQLLLAGLTRSQEQGAAVAGAGTRLQGGLGQVVLAPILTLPLCSCDINPG